MLLEYVRRLPEIFVCRSETRQWLDLTLTYLGIRVISYPYTVALRTGESLNLCEPMDLVIFWLVFARRHYPVDASDRTIVDVGANVGIFTLYAARRALSARIISIEPFPDNFERLTRLVRANRLEARVTTLNYAIAGSSGEAMMDTELHVPSQHRRVISPLTNVVAAVYQGRGMPEVPVEQTSTVATSNGVPVRTETIVKMLEKVGMPNVDFAKFNIHGNEYEVLLSTSPSDLRRFRRLAVQYHEVPRELMIGKQQLFEHFIQAGFEVTSDEDTGRGSGLAVFTARS